MIQANRLFWVAAALCLSGAGAYAFAQPKSAPPATGAHPDDGCPMHEIGELASAKVEQTKQGATIVLTAKRSEDVTRVQHSAHDMAAMLNKGVCPMASGHGGMMHMGHGHHMHHHGSQPPATSDKQ